MKKILLIEMVCMLCITSSITAQELFWEENGASSTSGISFIQKVDANNISSNTTDWYVFTGNTGNQQVTTVAPLVLSGYPKSGTGNAFRTSTVNAAGAFQQNNIEYNRRFGNEAGSQTLYLSMILKPFQIRGDYETFPLGFVEITNNDNDPSAISRNWAGRLLIGYAGTDALSGAAAFRDADYHFGITKNGPDRFIDAAKVYSGTADLSVFVVMKLTMDGDNTNGNDILELYSSTTFPTEEPEVWDLTVTTGEDYAVNGAFIREKMDNGSALDHFVDFGNLRAADSWDGLFGSFYDGQWSLGEPTADLSGVVQADLTVSSTLTTKNLTVAEGNTVTVSRGAALDVTGDLTTLGALDVSSGGSLLTYLGNDVVGDVKYRRNSSFTDEEKQYSFIGSPVAGVEITELGAGFHYTYSTTTDSYVAFDGAMLPGFGYTSAGKEELIFTGIPNNGEVVIPIDDSANGYNFIANPYGAAIDRAAFASANAAIDGTIYLWDDGGSDAGTQSSADFVTVNNAGVVSGGSGSSGATFNQFIGAAQGFFVKATTSGVASFTESMRSNGNNADGNFFREAAVSSFKLQVSNAFQQDETLVAFSSEGSEGFDRMWDAEKFIVNEELSLSTKMEDQRNLAIQTLRPLSDFDEVNIPVEVMVKSRSALTFKLTDLEIGENHKILLVDHMNAREYNLSNELTLDLAPNEENRFSLSIRPASILAVEEAREDFRIFIGSDDEINMAVPELNGAASLTLYDLNGKIYYADVIDFNSSGNARVEGYQLQSERIYIAFIQQGDVSFSTKFFVKH